MNRKTIWLVSVIVLSAMLVLSLGHVQAQMLTGYIPVFMDELGTQDVSVIFQTPTENIGIGTTNPVARLTVNANIANVFPVVPGIMIGSASGTTAIWQGKDANNYLEMAWLDSPGSGYGRVSAGGAFGKPLVFQENGGTVFSQEILPCSRDYAYFTISYLPLRPGLR